MIDAVTHLCSLYLQNYTLEALDHHGICREERFASYRSKPFFDKGARLVKKLIQLGLDGLVNMLAAAGLRVEVHVSRAA